MAKKRGLSDSDRKESKRLPFSKQSTPMGNEKKESNILNDSLLKMYKKGLEAKKEYLDLNETSAEDKPKDNDASTKTPARAGKRSKTIIPKNSTVDFSDVGGMDNHLKEILHMLVHFQVPTLFKKSEVPSVGGILLYGPPGCGKTHLARAIAGQLKVPLIEVMATELVHGISGESENKIRGIFEAAVAAGRCILFIDEIDVICPKRATTDNEMSKRMVAQMIKCLDELRDREANVVVIGATNTPDSIDTSLRRGLRFTRELSIGLPNEEARFKILKILCKKIQLTPDFDFHWLAHHTPGYVGADLTTLVFTAMVLGLCRMYKQPF
ncbi:nuclear valosin-containing protein-like [Caerostris extrusa]|uniref:Nuclear valosin-containing protein-like n=1 Tax=Caerostris extrusa TaxID=172846 RepID=A0AAV4QWD0_CAEEX|nr:nuclear valosin-containing protein-like [Caerostris extrusa]